jgi:hypothetical protein
MTCTPASSEPIWPPVSSTRPSSGRARWGRHIRPASTRPAPRFCKARRRALIAVRGRRSMSGTYATDWDPIAGS